MTEKQLDTRELLLSAHDYYQRGDMPQAEAVYRRALVQDPANRDALQNLIAIALQSQDLQKAASWFALLVSAAPEEPAYVDKYAGLLFRLGRVDEALAAYRHLLDQFSHLASSRYNYARLLRRARRPEEAIFQYKVALTNGIDDMEQVLTNIGVIHGEQQQTDEARDAYDRALRMNGEHVPALYNLALLEQECGDVDAARHRFERILELDPAYSDALAQIAQCGKVENPADPIFSRLEERLQKTEIAIERENLSYALAKSLDDSQQYERAFAAYRQANELGRARSGGYDRQLSEDLFSRLRAYLADQAGAEVNAVSEQPLIFICGMFRSGSTLLEQMLASHPALSAGGEIRYFQEQAPLPEALDWQSDNMRELGQGYLDKLQQLVPEVGRISNKRPDNFLYLGLILKLFPNAQIIVTDRDALDNCLSVYFQPFAEPLGYDTELADTAHYYQLLQSLFEAVDQHHPGRVHRVRYEQLVAEPRAVLEPLLCFLDLAWDDACLDFQALTNRVRTASVWQVRQPLQQSSRGRWKNYIDQPELAALKPLFDG